MFDNGVTSIELYHRFNNNVWSLTQNRQFILHLTITSNISSRLTDLLIAVISHYNHLYYLLDLVLYKL